MATKLSLGDAQKIKSLVDRYRDKKQQQLLQTFQKSVLVAINESADLMQLTHTIRSRIKDPDHLRNKLLRKMAKCEEKGTEFDITPQNLFTAVTDLAGIRILHLHTKQVKEIDGHLKSIIAEQGLGLLEGPFARTWDDEYRKLFESFGFETQPSERMYTSVHYVLTDKAQGSFTCEIQVRTLMEEVWGEVDHTMNYPTPSKSLPCREQILALARATSTATRLVDAIFETMNDFGNKKPSKKKAQPEP